jgi:hypothetical protein
MHAHGKGEMNKRNYRGPTKLPSHKYTLYAEDLVFACDPWEGDTAFRHAIVATLIAVTDPAAQFSFITLTGHKHQPLTLREVLPRFCALMNVMGKSNVNVR